MAASGRKAPAIAIGAHEAFGGPSGIGRYQTALVEQLAPRVDLHLLVNTPFEAVARAPGAPPALSRAKIHYPTSPAALKENRGAILSGLLRHPSLLSFRRSTLEALVSTRLAQGIYADKQGFDLLHGTASYMPLTKRVKARVVTVHDTTPLTMPDRHARDTVKGFLRPKELQETDHVVVGSASSQKDFERAFSHASERVHVIPYGVNHEIFRPGPSPAGGPPYVVSVGMIEPRKNLVRGLAAFEQVGRIHPDLRWKVVGRKGWGWAEFEAALAASAVKDRVDVLGPVDDQALALLYRGARALFFPSLWEGLGIPVLEALAAGTAVAASRIPPLEEAGAGVVELADPQDVEALAEALHRAAMDDAGRPQRINAGIERAAKFRWDLAAEQHLAVYAEALGCTVAEIETPKGGAL